MRNIYNFVQFKDFNTTQALTILLGWTVLFTYTVASKEEFKLTHFSNYMAIANFGHVVWRIKKNGIPVAPYDNIRDQIGISTLPRSIESINGRGGDLIEIEATLLAGAADPNDVGIAVKYEVM